MYNPALAEVIATDGLTFAELRVLLRLVAQAPLGECQEVRQTKLARVLGLHRNTIARALDSLIERGWVIRAPDDPGCLWVDPELAYRGYEDAYESLVELLKEAR